MAENANTPAPARPAHSLTTGTSSGGLIPRNLEELWKLAGLMVASGMMPKGMQTEASVSVAIQMGLEVGLSPMQAVQNIAVINGRPSLWGDAMLGLVQGSGLLENMVEERIDDDGGGYCCTLKRKGRPAPIVHTFTMADAKRAKLAAKPGPWQEYPMRMCQMRARSFALRDGFADVLRGLIAREEAMDLPPETGEYQDVTPPRQPTAAEMEPVDFAAPGPEAGEPDAAKSEDSAAGGPAW